MCAVEDERPAQLALNVFLMAFRQRTERDPQKVSSAQVAAPVAPGVAHVVAPVAEPVAEPAEEPAASRLFRDAYRHIFSYLHGDLVWVGDFATLMPDQWRGRVLRSRCPIVRFAPPKSRLDIGYDESNMFIYLMIWCSPTTTTTIDSD